MHCTFRFLFSSRTVCHRSDPKQIERQTEHDSKKVTHSHEGIAEVCPEARRTCFPDSGRTFGLFVGAFFGVFALAAITVFACGFHVAMHDAIGRIEDRERKQRSDDETI